MPTFPNYPATTFDQAVELTIVSSNQISNVVNGSATDEVATVNGLIPTLRKALTDNFYFKDPIAWAEGSTETVFNQLRYFQDTSVAGWYYAPSATTLNPITMGASPEGDPLWRLYALSTIQVPANVYSWSFDAAVGGETVIEPPYEFTTAIVTINGVVQIPEQAFTINNNQIILAEPLGVDPVTGEVDKLFAIIGDVIPNDVNDLVLKSQLNAPNGVEMVGNAVDARLLSASEGVTLVGNAVDARVLSSGGADKTVGSSFGGSIYSDYSLTPYSRKGDFLTGATLTSEKEALLHSDGYYYISKSTTFPVVVTAGSVPDSTNFLCVGFLNGYPVNNIRNFVSDPNNATAGVQKLADFCNYTRDVISICGFSSFTTNATVSLASASIEGAGRERQTWFYNGSGDAIIYTNSFSAKGFVLKSTTLFNGRGLVNTGQQAFNNFEDFSIENFRYGQVARYTIWGNWKNVTFRNNACHLRLLRNASATDGFDPVATSFWNDFSSGNGWFHNVLSLVNVLFDGGEVGIWGTPMCMTADSVTTQLQLGRGVSGSNLVLPTGVEPVGMYLQAGSSTLSTTTTGNFNVEISNLYAENGKSVIHAEGMAYVKINSMFTQGRPSSDPSEYIVKATSGSTVEIGAIIGQDYFKNLLVVERNATISANRIRGPLTALNGFVKNVDGSGWVKLESPSGYYFLDITAGNLNAQFDITPLSGGFHYVDVFSTRDGFVPNSSSYSIMRWATFSQVNELGVSGTLPYSLSIVAEKLTLTVLTNNKLQVTLLVKTNINSTYSSPKVLL